ncbi:hypothetical protein P170DRAFT_243185 [Aspergillus steynii IBT 23096]|uniref:Uncharacterized protein n=1 Tax=Aspergillus steynii IBT 23096 TaxID=1392250 RepID=A0A2I2FXP8_9EURO|nr:uncharacterized protein P170DRAFT_243185 [Aspergillus steynii IBT 23096]PLB45408.1 hypothetical protein P170DRAFT_243185 [Aspergillus steynii IBT 23096]
MLRYCIFHSILPCSSSPCFPLSLSFFFLSTPYLPIIFLFLFLFHDLLIFTLMAAGVWMTLMVHVSATRPLRELEIPREGGQGAESKRCNGGLTRVGGVRCGCSETLPKSLS